MNLNHDPYAANRANSLTEALAGVERLPEAVVKAIRARATLPKVRLNVTDRTEATRAEAVRATLEAAGREGFDATAIDVGPLLQAQQDQAATTARAEVLAWSRELSARALINTVEAHKSDIIGQLQREHAQLVKRFLALATDPRLATVDEHTATVLGGSTGQDYIKAADLARQMQRRLDALQFIEAHPWGAESPDVIYFAHVKDRVVWDERGADRKTAGRFGTPGTVPFFFTVAAAVPLASQWWCPIASEQVARLAEVVAADRPNMRVRTKDAIPAATARMPRSTTAGFG